MVRFLNAADEVESACTNRGRSTRNRFVLLQRRIWTAGGTSPTCRLPCKSKSRRKRKVSGHARESVHAVDQDSGLRTSASRRMVPASDAGPDIHLLYRARESRHR